MAKAGKISEPSLKTITAQYLYETYSRAYYATYKYKESITPWEEVSESTKPIWEAFSSVINKDFPTSPERICY